MGRRRYRHRRPWQTKCYNCGHNVIKRHGRWWHRNYNPGLQPGEDGDDPGEFGYIEYTQRCRYSSCQCARPFFKGAGSSINRIPNSGVIHIQPNPKSGHENGRRKGVTAVVVIVIALILGVFVYINLNGNSSANVTSTIQTTISQIGMQSNPYQPNPNNTLEWQGPGYYSVPTNVPASGLNKGVDYLSSQSQAESYNQWAYHAPVNTTTTSTSTVTSVSTISTTTISQAAQNNLWATQFFENISAERGSQYNYCPALSQFAQIRFNSQISNYEISHYGVTQDDEDYGIYAAEEVLFPSGSPAAYASQLSVDDPLHWQLLIGNSYTYYGDYIGSGPVIESYCPSSARTEIPGPNINVSQYLISQGCTPVTETATYLMVELDNICPSEP